MIVILRAAALTVLCLYPAALSAQFRTQRYTTSNGLPQNSVAALAQTRDGYLWIGTNDGLVRYDGVRFTIFDKGNTPAIQSNRFLALHVDPEGTLWAGTVDGGLTRYRNGVFTSVTTQQGLESDYIGRFADSPGGMIAFYEGEKPAGLIRPDGTVARATDQVQSDFVDRSGTRWVLQADGLHRIRKGGDDRLFPIPLEPNEFARFRYEDRGGHLWLGTRRAGVYRISGDAVTHFGDADGVPTDDIVKVVGEDNAGGVCLFSQARLMRYADGRMAGWDLVATIGTQGRVALCDREGTMWVGTGSDGLVRLSRPIITTYSEEQGLQGRVVYPVAADRSGGIWTASGRGPARITSQGITSYRADAVGSLIEDAAGRIIVAVGRRLATVRDGALVDIGVVLPAPVHAFANGPDGSLWIGGGAGVSQVRDDRIVRTLSMEQGLPASSANALRFDRQGRLWAGTPNGLARLDGDRFTAFTTRNGLVGNRIRSLYEDADGALWIGTFDSGLSRLKDGRFTNFTTAHGLFNNGVFAIVEDSAGYFWISCNRGIYRVSRNDLNAVAEGRKRFVHSVAFGTQDGMRSSECNGGRDPSAARTPDGRIWFPTLDGVAVVDPNAVARNAQSPAVVIESVLVDDAPVDWRGGVRVKPDARELEIAYTAPSSIKAEHIQFRYRLAGVNDDWIDAGTRRVVHYSHLPHGRYAFTVIAANSDGVWNETGVTFPVVIEPRFYQTAWFMSLCGLAAMGVSAAGFALRVRALKRNEQRLTALVEERTAELRETNAALEVANTALEELATADALTAVANRRRFDVFLQQEWQRADRTRLPLSLLLVDVDHFKSYNDTYGHQGGDDCLRRVATILQAAATRVSDLAARYGGEEFAVVLVDTGQEGAATVAEFIRNGVEQLQIPHSGAPSGVVTVSVGAGTRDGERYGRVADLIAACDKALYEAKRAGRNRVVSA